MSDIYRSAASLLVLRPVTASGIVAYQILLLHKPRKKDAWQLPQGGVESGESVEQAALRELQEEAGIGNATIVGRTEHVYQYDFPPSFRKFRPDNVCGQRIEHLFAVVGKDAPVRVDGKEIDAFAWVDRSQLRLYIKRKAYLDLVGRLYREALQNLERHS
ncbi:NUDIX domain-containing protein [Candidatus Peregrinibacteria bacterium]|nr:NUDIX domain-containing protein [Candidatus Peregrinibacteria bacterium]MBI3816242.1 NUDIX domain-containing protein [Candidatus Peregrinibacteria bacterium]